MELRLFADRQSLTALTILRQLLKKPQDWQFCCRKTELRQSISAMSWKIIWRSKRKKREAAETKGSRRFFVKTGTGCRRPHPRR